MCDPGTLIVLTSAAITIAAAQGIVSHAQAQGQANAENAYQKRLVQQRQQQIEENTKLATNDFNRKAYQEQLGLQENQQQASQAIFQNQIKARQAEATARVSAGEAGVAGLSIDSLLADFQRQQSVYADSVNQNYDMKQRQSNANLEGYAYEAKGRVQSLQPYIATPVQGPSKLATGLQIAGQSVQYVSSAFNEYNSYKANQAQARALAGIVKS